MPVDCAGIESMQKRSLSVFFLWTFLSCSAFGQDAEKPRSPASPNIDEKTQKLFDEFKSQLEGAALVGSFTTIDEKGKPTGEGLTSERYEIKGVKKAENGDYWIIRARIQYGERDMLFPVPVEVKWAGTTPVIIVDDVSIPGLGTFGSRVVIHNGKYAGTWRHDDVGGHLFGKIEKAKTSD